jgi:hypothetical protein
MSKTKKINRNPFGVRRPDAAFSPDDGSKVHSSAIARSMAKKRRQAAALQMLCAVGKSCI